MDFQGGVIESCWNGLGTTWLSVVLGPRASGRSPRERRSAARGSLPAEADRLAFPGRGQTVGDLRWQWTLLIACWVGFCCGCSSLQVAARPPGPVVNNTQSVAGTALTDVSDVPHGQACASSFGAKELCVTDLRVAFDYGLKNVAQAVFKGTGPRYVLTFRVIEFAHFPWN